MRLCHPVSFREAPAAGLLLNLHAQAVLLSQWLKCLTCLKCSCKGCSSVLLMCKIWAENSKAKLHSKEERALGKVIVTALPFITCLTLGRLVVSLTNFRFCKLGIITLLYHALPESLWGPSVKHYCYLHCMQVCMLFFKKFRCRKIKRIVTL